MIKPPSTKDPVIFTTTAAGPTPQVPVSRGVAVAVGNEKVGPTPQIMPFGLAGVRKICAWMSPTPLYLVPSGPGTLLIGTIVRAITFQFCEALNGITGWTFRLKSVRSLEITAGVEVELERHADEAAQRILRFTGERVDVVRRRGNRRLSKGCCRTDADQRGGDREGYEPVHHLVDRLAHGLGSLSGFMRKVSRKVSSLPCVAERAYVSHW